MKKTYRIDKNKLGIDDVAIEGKLFRLERMTKDVFWGAVYGGKKTFSFQLHIKGKKIICGEL